MVDGTASPNGKRGPGNGGIAALCVAAVIGMVGMAYAAVPLYNLFCRATGYGGTTQLAVNSEGVRVIDRDIKIHFDANVAKGFGWEFAPVKREVTLKMGETAQIAYHARNLTDRPLTGTAAFNVTPQSAGAYFNKIECFCFTETTLQPGEELILPVVFFVDPDMADEAETRNIHTITLSYTFFEKEPAEKPVAALGGDPKPEDGVKTENKL
ncbi:MAG: cytochrome c oxidase assembly protein [Nitratireductor sp.]|nr:cytochrome c oxidase assembly protein [Nitratireductor sp.]